MNSPLHRHLQSVAALAAFLLASVAPLLQAQVPQLINYQGRVAVGAVNFDGSGQFKFALVNAAGITTYWSNDGTSTAGSQPTAAVTLTVTKGLYSVLLGDTSLANMTIIPASVWTNADVRLRVWFNDGTNGSQLLTPDQRLAPHGYLPNGSVSSAAIAGGAVTAAKIGSDVGLWSVNGADVFRITGNVGINKNNPATTLDVNGIVTATSFSGSGTGLTGFNAANVATGTLADGRLSGNVALLNAAQTFSAGKTFSAAPSFTAAGSPFLVTSPALVTNLNADLLDGLSSTAFLQSVPMPLNLTGASATQIIRGENSSTSSGASGVYGVTTAASGVSFGVFGQSASTSGQGVTGVASATSGTTYGVYAESASTSGLGVFGLATAATGTTYGGRFDSGSTSGRGVFGFAGAATGGAYGVQGESASTSGRGVYGLATAATGSTSGIYGDSVSPTGIGVRGRAQATTGANYGGFFATNSTSGIGVYGDVNATTGTNSGVYGESASTSGRGVFGEATAASGLTYGGRFECASTGGFGVFGIANAATGTNYGVNGVSFSTAGRGVAGHSYALTGTTYGVYGESASTGGTGVKGVNTAGAVGVKGEGGYGVYGESNTTGGYGVVGLASAATGTTYGVYGLASGSGLTYGLYGESAGTSGRGVYGKATAATGITRGGQFLSDSADGYGVWASGGATGVYGEAIATSGITNGVYGRSDSPSGNGIYGIATATSGSTTNAGVLGRAGVTGGWGVFAQGNLGASGTKSFCIDHPDDPANKYLLHYCAESPEVINFYSETVTLDERGEAVVELPHYFAKINTRPRYQLTAVGAPMPNLHVAGKISESALSAGAAAGPDEVAPLCSFRIAGGAPGGEVSWEVKAVRNDRWVQNRGAPVEVQKQDLERGTYQHPGFYGQPPEKGMNYDATTPRATVLSAPEPLTPARPRDGSQIQSGGLSAPLDATSIPKPSRPEIDSK